MLRLLRTLRNGPALVAPSASSCSDSVSTSGAALQVGKLRPRPHNPGPQCLLDPSLTCGIQNHWEKEKEMSTQKGCSGFRIVPVIQAVSPAFRPGGGGLYIRPEVAFYSLNSLPIACQEIRCGPSLALARCVVKPQASRYLQELTA